MGLVVHTKEIKQKDLDDKLFIATCKIDGKEKYVYHTDKDEGVDVVNCKEAKAQLIKLKNQIYSVFISAPSGAGKSYMANDIAMRLLKEHKEIEDVFLYTASNQDDPAYDKLREKGKITKMDMLNPEIYNIPIDVFENSICLFDDFDKVAPDIKKMVFLKLEQFLTLGRKLNINVITCLHETLQYNLTRCVIFESQNVILFPKSAIRTTNQFLKTYQGFNEDELQQLKKHKTRTIYLHKTSPQYYITDDCIKLL